MRFFKKSFSLFLFFFLTISCIQSKEKDEIKILFIGNSYTYYNSSPELLKALIHEKFPTMEIKTQLISGGGMALANHWQNEATIQTIRTGDWDYVVLQEQSKLGMAVMIDYDMYFGQTDRFFEYARKFNSEITKAGAKTVFLMTWSVRDRPNEQAILTHAYTSIAKELHAVLSPVGLVWDDLRTNPNINLYADDGGHPSPMGSYVSAVTLYATLMADNPLGLSGVISGNPLSSTGERSLNKELIINLTTEDAKVIQEASWKVVKSIQESNGYLDIEQPALSYSIPVLSKGETIKLKNITGKWYGTSTYGYDYLGQIMEIKNVDGKPKVSLSFYSPHVQDKMRIDKATIEEDQLILNFYDSLRTRNATLRFSLHKGNMEGILESSGNFHMYKHFKFSKTPIHNGIDLSMFGLLMESFQHNTLNKGYVKAALEHYEQYSKLIGETYKPEEFYLNAVGYNFLRADKVNDALNTFELAITYYPQSVNVYDSYAEALLLSGRKDVALEVYIKAYELAKKTGYENLPYIEENLNKLKNNTAVDLGSESIPPPPPPPAPSQ
ncbi:hypothetical protein EP331_11285 [bacterium]|nr:MAG: hypothetical protein EP331_11285 [bacterium]